MISDFQGKITRNLKGTALFEHLCINWPVFTMKSRHSKPKKKTKIEFNFYKLLLVSMNQNRKREISHLGLMSTCEFSKGGFTRPPPINE